MLGPISFFRCSINSQDVRSSMRETGFRVKDTGFRVKSKGFREKGTGFTPYINLPYYPGL